MTHISRRTLGVAAVALSAGAFFAVSAGAEPVNGQPAPDFTAVDVNGVEVSLADYSDQTVVLEWTNHQCPYVMKHYGSGNMQATQAAATEDYDVVWLQIVSSAPGTQGHVSPQEALALNEERGAAPTTTILDEAGAIGRLYDARTTPHMYVIENGVLRYQGGIDDRPSAATSSLDGATNYVLAALEALESGEEIETAQSQPYGCTVKYSRSGA